MGRFGHHRHHGIRRHGIRRFGIRRGGGMRIRAFHRTGLLSRTRNRTRHRHAITSSYFRGRRVRYHWGTHSGIFPEPWWSTPDFQSRATQGLPQVQARRLTVVVVPYAATLVALPPGVGAGSLFRFSHPGTVPAGTVDGGYLIVGPADAAPGLPVQLMLPPVDVPPAADRVDVLTNLVASGSAGSGGAAARPHTVDLDGDGVPDATPFVPGQDAFITVMADQGSVDQLRMFVPSTSLLTLRHLVDAIDSWGEATLERRFEANSDVIDTEFVVDMVQLGLLAEGSDGADSGRPRWEHEQFVPASVPVAPRVVSVVVPDDCPGPGALFTVGPDVTGAAEPLHVRVPADVKPGQAIDVAVPNDQLHAQKMEDGKAVDAATAEAGNPDAWRAPPGMDLFAELAAAQFQLTVGALEISVYAPPMAATSRRRKCYVAVICVVLTLALIVGLSVGLTVGGSNAYVTGYSNGQWCSSYYDLSPACAAVSCPTQPSGTSARLCWDNLEWAALTPAVQADWATLGYTQYTWDNDISPSSVDTCMGALPSMEYAAALRLGFVMETWNYPWRC